MSAGPFQTGRPALRYHGGKFRLVPSILPFFPPHEVYVEPFGGAASLLLAKEQTRIEVYNDLDLQMVNYFRVLRDPEKAERLRVLVELTCFSRKEFEDAFEQAADDVEEARRLIVRSFQSIGNKHRTERSGWRTRTAKSIWSPCIAWGGVARVDPRLHRAPKRGDLRVQHLGKHAGVV